MRPFLPFAAVLTAALLLGCQDQGSEPVGPDVVVLPFEPQSDKPAPGAACPGGVRDLKGHCHDDAEPTPAATFTLLHNGDVTTSNLITSNLITDAGPGGGKEGTSVSFGGVNSTDQIVLSAVFVMNLPGTTDPFECFSPADIAEGISAGFHQGKRSNTVNGSYTFTALGTDGSQLSYSLELRGDFTTSDGGTALAPATKDAFSTVIWSGGLLHVGNGSDDLGCVGGGGKHSTLKEVTVSGGVTITRN